MSLNHLRDKIHLNACQKGWYEPQQCDNCGRDRRCFFCACDATRPVPELLALIHSEVSEALEVYRETDPAVLPLPVYNAMGPSEQAMGPSEQGGLSPKAVLLKPVGFDSELADILIRTLDLAGHLGIDIERAVAEKMTFNETRPYRHGGKRA